MTIQIVFPCPKTSEASVRKRHTQKTKTSCCRKETDHSRTYGCPGQVSMSAYFERCRFIPAAPPDANTSGWTDGQTYKADTVPPLFRSRTSLLCQRMVARHSVAVAAQVFRSQQSLFEVSQLLLFLLLFLLCYVCLFVCCCCC